MALAGVALNLAGVAVGVVDVASRVPGGLPVAAFGLGVRASDTLGLAVLAVLVILCHHPAPTPRARALTVAALAAALLSLLVGVVLLVVAFTVGRGVGAADLLLVVSGLVVPALAVGVLALLSRTPVAAADPDRAALDSARDRAAGRDAVGSAASAEPTPDPARQPTWEPGAASGAAWLTAGAAAAGDLPVGWGRPGESAGWQPTPGPGRSATPELSAAPGSGADLTAPISTPTAPSAPPHPWAVDSGPDSGSGSGSSSGPTPPPAGGR